MATDITAAGSGSFTTTNMKPEVNDQIDALHGQNLADNTGYVYYREVPLTARLQDTSCYFAFTKKASHDALRILNANTAAYTGANYLWVMNSGADWASPEANNVLNGTFARTFSDSVVYDDRLDISTLTNGNNYLVQWRSGNAGVHVGIVGSQFPVAASMMHGSSATY